VSGSPAAVRDHDARTENTEIGEEINETGGENRCQHNENNTENRKK
jgi:hypothetical protein